MRLINEEYINSTEQMAGNMKASAKQQKKYDKEFESRKEFAISVLGKLTYNKYYNKGIFAPLPLSAIKLSFEDFYQLNPNNKNIKMLDKDDIVKTKTVIKHLNKYSNNEIYRVIDNGFKYMLQTNTVLKTFDDVIDLLANINKAYKTAYRKKDSDNDINWKGISLKFRKYLN